jgi:hypothetical protein
MIHKQLGTRYDFAFQNGFLYSFFDHSDFFDGFKLNNSIISSPEIGEIYVRDHVLQLQQFFPNDFKIFVVFLELIWVLVVMSAS